MQDKTERGGVPVVSVIMPVFNGSRYIREAIDSILEQSLCEIELIVIDDGSIDSTADVVKSLTDARVRYYFQRNQGCSRAINKGLQLARGEFVAHCDSDDIWHRDKLEIQMDILRSEPETILVGTWANIINDRGKIIGTHKHEESSSKISLHLIFENPFVHSSILYRKDIARNIGGYTRCKDLVPPEDYEFICRLAMKGRLRNIRQILVDYRHHDQGLSKKSSILIQHNKIKISELYIISIDRSRLSESAICVAEFAHKPYPNKDAWLSQFKALIDLVLVLKDMRYLSSRREWIYFAKLVVITRIKKLRQLNRFNR